MDRLDFSRKRRRVDRAGFLQPPSENGNTSQIRPTEFVNDPQPWSNPIQTIPSFPAHIELGTRESFQGNGLEYETIVPSIPSLSGPVAGHIPAGVSTLSQSYGLINPLETMSILETEYGTATGPTALPGSHGRSDLTAVVPSPHGHALEDIPVIQLDLALHISQHGESSFGVPTNNLYAVPTQSSNLQGNFFLGQELDILGTSHGSRRPKDGLVPKPDTVCFGMISGIVARYQARGFVNEATPFSVQLVGSNKFSDPSNPDVQGFILPEHGQMIQCILDDSDLDIFVSCIPEAAPPIQGKPNRTKSQTPCILEITLYGPLDLFEDMGTWCQDYRVYLQAPRSCLRDAKYCNPQMLTFVNFESSPTVSEVVRQQSTLYNLQDVPQGPDLLDVLSTSIDLDEAPQPSLIATQLKKHQRQALTFMLRREQGWALYGSDPDIWMAMDKVQGQFFLNRITDVHQTERPQQFYGGIIGDPMGLGKTLTMIALVATDLDANTGFGTRMDLDEDLEDETIPTVSATLIVVPPPLVGTWEEQITEHVVDSGLRCRRHHGKSRILEVHELDGVDIVLTTYHTISVEWKPAIGRGNSVIFSVRWRRLILDEGHLVRNESTRMTRSICSIEAVSRWAVTGTPIQNRLSDLASLVKFIRAYPYTDTKRFEEDISYLWKAGEERKAVDRLKKLSACLLLRRPKSTIDLPPRSDFKYRVYFSPQERALYSSIKEQAIIRIDEALEQDSEVTRVGAYVNVLQQIESLRLICDLGLYYHARHETDFMKQQSISFDDWDRIAQQIFNTSREMGQVVCSQCSSTLDLTETLAEDSATIRKPDFSRCLKYTCVDCCLKNDRAGQTVSCGHGHGCPVAKVSLETNDSERLPMKTLMPAEDRLSLPTKIQCLVVHIRNTSPDKCVVFSTWRLTLDVTEAALSQAGLSTLRFDGKVPQKERQSVIERFRADPTVRVMLLTLSCGAVGLTLTAASRAYLMEPHWNPTVEEQALGRIHRMGQKREVETIRFYVEDSFEERVMEMQDRKRDLAGLLLSQHDGIQSDDSLARLQRLRSLL